MVRAGELAGFLAWLESRAALWPVFRPYLDVLDEAAAVDREMRGMVEGWHEEVISDLVRGMEQAGRRSSLRDLATRPMEDGHSWHNAKEPQS